MKQWVQKNGDQARDAWGDRQNPDRAINLLIGMTEAVTPGNAFGWFGRAGIV